MVVALPYSEVIAETEGRWDVWHRYEHIRVELRDAVLWVTFDNPPVNAPTAEMKSELSHLFRDISLDARVRCVVITGTGAVFSAGGDINRMQQMVEDRARWALSMPEARRLVTDMLDCDKPVIARINGPALGLGATIALCCDITVMAESAVIGDTHVKIGLAAGDGGALLWPHLVGLVQARRYLLTGDPLTGAEAAKIGLVTVAVASEELDGEVNRWVEKLASGATRALAGTKRSLNMALRQQAAAYMDAHLGLETLSQMTADHAGAVDAFLNKRPPSFRGE